jgi:hypothetical protein
MRYGEQDRQSDQFEDRRGEGPFPGGGRRIAIPISGMSLGSIILIGIVCLLLGINPLALLGGGGLELPDMPRPERRTGQPDVPGLPGQPGVDASSSDQMARFVRQVLADSEDVWTRVFQASGRTYEKPTLVVFSGSTRTACGVGQSAMGPFYCPLDQKVYIDLSFYDFMKRRFGAPGDFAQAYVITHEVGHHVQKLIGIADKVRQAQQRAGNQVEANRLQVRMELQADCFAGVWASLNEQVKSRLEPGDIDEALKAAAAIGDDMIQKKTQGHVVPDAFTHGTSAQRVKWFRRGLDTGQVQACDTFNVPEL